MWLPLLISIIITLALISWLFMQIKKYELQLPKWMLAGGVLLKLFFAFCLYWLFTNYYTERKNADIYKYFDDAMAIQQACEENKLSSFSFFNPWQVENELHHQLIVNTQHWDLSTKPLLNGNRSMTRIHLLLIPISNGHFLFHQFMFCIIGILGLWWLFLFCWKETKLNAKLLFSLLFVFPSIALWTSGALKESILFFALGGLLYQLSKLSKKFKFSTFMLASTFGLLCLHIKAYVILGMLPALLSWMVFKWIKSKEKSYKILISSFLMWLLIFSLFATEINQILNQKLQEFTQLALVHNAGSYFEIQPIEGLKGLILSIPQALYNIFLRPLFTINFSPFNALASLEHAIMLAILVLAIVFPKPSKSQKDYQFLWLSISIIIPLAFLIGSTIPVLGAIARYKIVLLPFYLVALLNFADLKRIPFLNRFQ